MTYISAFVDPNFIKILQKFTAGYLLKNCDLR